MSLQGAPDGLQRPSQGLPEPSEAIRSAFRALQSASRAVTEAKNGPQNTDFVAQDQLSEAVSALRKALTAAPAPLPGVGESRFPQ